MSELRNGMPEAPATPELAHLSPLQLDFLVRRAHNQGLKAIASSRGVSLSTVRSIGTVAYRKLQADGAIDAFRRLGWLRVPEVLP